MLVLGADLVDPGLFAGGGDDRELGVIVDVVYGDVFFRNLMNK